MRATILAAVLAACSVTPLPLNVARAVAGEGSSTVLRSASEFLSPALRAEQADDIRNRGMLWVEQGEQMWRRSAGDGAPSCQGCHGDAAVSMRGVAARLPSVDRASGALVNLEGRINTCRRERQNLAPLAYESDGLLALTAYLTHQSKGVPFDVAVDGTAAAFYDLGRALWTERQGQLNLACTQCHDRNVGRRLRGDTISSAVPTGYPAYRLEWQTLGSLHRRLRACQLGVRARLFDPGSPEYLALELFLKARAKGYLIEAPALRR